MIRFRSIAVAGLIAFSISTVSSVLQAWGQVSTGQRSQRDETASAIERFAARLASDIVTDSVGGISAAVVMGNEVAWARGFGFADRQRRIRATDSTIYRTGSISKTFTAVLLLQLVERGLVGLYDPVVQHLPEFARLDGASERVPTITLAHLASHTGGLIREPALANAASGPIGGWESKVIESIPTTSLENAPGAAYSYSNIGFGILGLTLSRAAARSFMDLIEELTFDRLGMEHSTFVIDSVLDKYLAVGYANSRDGTINSELPAREHAGRGYKVPNGGVYSTVHDLAKFVAALYGATMNPILSESSQRAMQKVHTPEDTARGYGIGVSIRATDAGVLLIGHGGSVAGYTAYMVFNPDAKIGVILLRNYNRGATNLGRAASALLEELVLLRASFSGYRQ